MYIRSFLCYFSFVRITLVFAVITGIKRFPVYRNLRRRSFLRVKHSRTIPWLSPGNLAFISPATLSFIVVASQHERNENKQTNPHRKTCTAGASAVCRYNKNFCIL